MNKALYLTIGTAALLVSCEQTDVVTGRARIHFPNIPNLPAALPASELQPAPAPAPKPTVSQRQTPPPAAPAPAPAPKPTVSQRQTPVVAPRPVPVPRANVVIPAPAPQPQITTPQQDRQMRTATPKRVLMPGQNRGLKR